MQLKNIKMMKVRRKQEGVSRYRESKLVPLTSEKLTRT